VHIEDADRAAFEAAGTDEDQAARVAAILVWCDLIGRQTHGTWRLAILCKRVELGLVSCPCRPKIESGAPGVLSMDGDNGFGLMVSELAMNHAIDAARQVGIGVVGVRNSNFFGAGAFYGNQAATAGMIGIATSNSVPQVAAIGGRRQVLGTNPFAFGAPRRNGRHFLLDMATSGLAGSTTRRLIERNEPLPEGFAIDAEGRPVTDPRKVKEGALLPFGGHKGYGLALMVEILSGVLTGAGISDEVKSMYRDFEGGGNNGHFIVALDIRRLMPLDRWYDRLEHMLEMLRASGPESPGVRYPGEGRWDAYAEGVQLGVALEESTVEALAKLAAEYNVRVPWEPAPGP
jgi:LDH2 family malate/lactate/ureidoglycolate dehydrogenase